MRFPGRQDLNFWCSFMCIQSINWPPHFSEVIRGKPQKPITVSPALNQTDKSLKRYVHEKLTAEFLRRPKYGVFLCVSAGVIYILSHWLLFSQPECNSFGWQIFIQRQQREFFFCFNFISDKILRSFLFFHFPRDSSISPHVSVPYCTEGFKRGSLDMGILTQVETVILTLC